MKQNKPHLRPVPAARLKRGDQFFTFNRDRTQITGVQTVRGVGRSTGGPILFLMDFRSLMPVCEVSFSKSWRLAPDKIMWVLV